MSPAPLSVLTWQILNLRDVGQLIGTQQVDRFFFYIIQSHESGHLVKGLTNSDWTNTTSMFDGEDD